jgi:hypothetical protein
VLKKAYPGYHSKYRAIEALEMIRELKVLEEV